MGSDKPRKTRAHARFNFETMRISATHENPQTRKSAFIDYFEEFHELPSYLFNNDTAIDPRLRQTIDDLLNDPYTTNALRSGIDTLLRRLPTR